MAWSQRFLFGLMALLLGGMVGAVRYSQHGRFPRARLVAIRIVTFGDVDKHLLTDLARATRRAFDLPAEVSDRIAALPASAYEASRRQYLAPALREQLRATAPPDVCVLGLTEADLYAADLDFVFGEGDLPGNVAVMSLSHLHAPVPGRKIDQALLRRRAAKIAIHEIGHLLGLRHCPHENCVMHYSSSLAELDRGGQDFCPDCRAKLR